MKKKASRLLTMFLVLCMILSTVSCKKTGQGEKESRVTETSYGQVWSAPNTVKIQQSDIDYAGKEEAVLSYQAVRNEYENAQLFITAEKDITRYELQTADLKNGKEVLKSDNFTVYVQKYVSFIDAWYGSNILPDALIPMEQAAAYGENTLLTATNGALWVTVYIPKETNPGLYEGNFTLVIDGEKGEEKLDIPVSVEVYDYTLADETKAKTLITWTYEGSAAGEMNGSIEMMETYYEFFLDYGISLQSLPIETMSGEEYVASLQEYWDRITSNTIMVEAGTFGSYKENNPEIMVEQILSMAEKTTPEQNLFEKSMIYHGDEPDIRDEAKRQEVIDDGKKIQATLQSCVETIKADTTDKYAGLKKIENWEDYIVNIRRVQTMVEFATEWIIANAKTTEGKAFLESLNTIFIKPIPEEDIVALKEIAAEHNIEIWWYTCNVPAAPASNLHIGDENLLSPRTISWYQAQHDIQGFLYWRAAATINNTENEFNDVYTNPFYFQGCPAGDGFLVYPGAAYGVYGPLPSLRLMSMRDGMEEYNLLRQVEEEFASMEEVFGEGFSVRAAMNTFYSSLGEGVAKVYSDGENGLNFTKLRTELLKTVTSVDAGLTFVMGDVKVTDNIAAITYFASEGATVTVQGKEQTPVAGTRYEYELDLREHTNLEVVITNADGKSMTYDRFIDNPSYVLNTLNDKTALAGIQVGDGCNAEIVSTEHSTDGTALHLNITGKVTGNKFADASYRPSASVMTSLFGDTKLTELTAITMDVYNPGELFKTEIRLYSGESYMSFGEYQIQPGMQTVTLEIAEGGFAQMDTADRLAFEFANTDDNDNVLAYEFYVDNMNGK